MLSKNQIKTLQALQFKKFRDIEKLFIAEGAKLVLEVVNNAPGIIKEVYATKEFIHQHQKELSVQKINYIEISEVELQKISLNNTPNKVLAVCNYLANEVQDVDFTVNFSFYLDDLRDPGNFGTIVRLAAWFGVNNIFCSPASCDLYNPKVIQSTMGAFLKVKVNYIELEELLSKTKVPIVYGAVLNGGDLYKQKLKQGLILIGNEANGIQDKNLKLIQCPISIPAAGANGTESLNAAMATAVICSEFYRQLNHKS